MTDGLDEEKLASVKRRSPLNQLVEPEAVARAVSFLLDEASSSITGVTLTVDAGSTA